MQSSKSLVDDRNKIHLKKHLGRRIWENLKICPSVKHALKKGEFSLSRSDKLKNLLKK